MIEEVELWGRRLQGVVAEHGVVCIDRVVVVPEAASTQDVARERAAKRPGLLVLAARQTAGRGRLGRRWTDTDGLGLAATFALGGAQGGAGGLSLAAGVAVCRTVEAALGREDRPGSDPRIGLRWPNDVVEARVGRRDRKIAGVLIEVGAGVAMVGVGINVRQAEGDFPPELLGGATSLAMLGSAWSRIDVAERLVLELDSALRMQPRDLAQAWSARDVIVGTRRTFEHAGIRVSGLVEAVAPTSEIQVRADGGEVVRLPAMTTSLIPA